MGDVSAGALLTIPARFSDHVAFAPDLAQVAVQQTIVGPPRTEIYALSDGSLLASLAVSDDLSPWPCQLVYVDDAIVYLEWWYDDQYGEGVRRWRVVRHRRPDWFREILAESVVGHAVKLGAIPGGFVVVAPDRLLLGSADGPLSAPVWHPALASAEALLLATDPASGRIAVTLGDTQRLIVLDTDLQILGATELPHAEAYHAWFCGPETLVTFGRFKAIRSWRIEGGSLVVQGHTWLSKEDVQFSDHTFPLGLTAVPSQGVVAFGRAADPPLWYDARTLEIATAPAVFGDRFPVWMSPGDRYAIMQDSAGLRVYDVGA